MATRPSSYYPTSSSLTSIGLWLWQRGAPNWEGLMNSRRARVENTFRKCNECELFLLLPPPFNDSGNSVMRPTFSNLMRLIIRVLVLVPGNISGSVDHIFSSGDPLSFARIVKPLLVRAGVFGGVR